MERGPMALFGAIVAVGVGPALWLGAQFGAASLTPAPRPPAVVEANQDVKVPGGAGAAPEETAEPTRNTRTREEAAPAKREKSEPVESPSESAEPEAEQTGEPAPTDDPTTPPPTESTGDPDDPDDEETSGTGDPDPADPEQPAGPDTQAA